MSVHKGQHWFQLDEETFWIPCTCVVLLDILKSGRKWQHHTVRTELKCLAATGDIACKLTQEVLMSHTSLCAGIMGNETQVSPLWVNLPIEQGV